MAVTLGSNVQSLRAVRQLGINTQKVGTVFERLSSGQRINRAADDAAGLAIADTLNTDSRLFNVANRNINDGISLINIAASSLSNQKQIIFRLQELAEQSANGVYSDNQRQALNKEYQALIQEFNRIGETSEFNGQKLLLAGRGDNASQYQLQVGINGSNDSVISIANQDTATFSGTISASTDFTEVGNSAPYDGNPDGQETLDDFLYHNNFVNSNPTFDQLATFSQNNMFRVSVTDSNGEQKDLIGIISLGNYLDAPDNNASFALYALSADGETYDDVGSLSSVSEDTRAESALTFALTFGDGATGSIELDFRALTITTDNTNTLRQTNIDFTGVETVGRARHALDRLGERLDDLSRQEGVLGSTQSRLETALEVTKVSRENYAAAESRIRDADIASESSELTRLTILQQSSASVLAQANIQPEIALLLLGR